jgi:hypothetical protein
MSEYSEKSRNATSTALRTGKIAENGVGRQPGLGFENKADQDGRAGSSPVNTQLNHPPSPTSSRVLSFIRHDPKIQEGIKRARQHDKRLASRKANQALRESIPKTRWKFASEAEKARYCAHAALGRSGVAFSLNLSREKAQRLRESADPCRSITDTLNRKLKDVGLSGLPYLFKFEESPSGKLHLHGVARRAICASVSQRRSDMGTAHFRTVDPADARKSMGPDPKAIHVNRHLSLVV